MAKRWEKVEAVTDFIFFGSKITVGSDCSHEIRRRLLIGRKMTTNIVCWKQRHSSADKGPYSQGYGLLSGHIWLWELDHKEGRMPKNWCLRSVVLEKTPQGPLDSKEIIPVNLKRNQPWILIGRTDAEADGLVKLCPRPMGLGENHSLFYYIQLLGFFKLSLAMFHS